MALEKDVVEVPALTSATSTAPDGTAAREWPVWSTTARVVVTDPGSLDEASAILVGVLTEVERACSRFLPTSDLAQLQPRLASGAVVSPLLATLVRVALDAARTTHGAVDPTLGNALARLGYDRSFEALELGRASHPIGEHREPEIENGGDVSVSPRGGWASAPVVTLSTATPGWRRIGLTATPEGQVLTVPADLALDLGATAKAYAADLAAARIIEALGGGVLGRGVLGGVLVALGGDIATAGTAPQIATGVDGASSGADGVSGRTGATGVRGATSGWQVLVQDLPGDPACQITLAAGQALATSSTQKRRWRQHGQTMHHILDPVRGLPVDPVWRTVTVAAASCVEANTLSTASVVYGTAGLIGLAERSVAARLVNRAGRVLTLGGWPDEDSVHVRAAG